MASVYYELQNGYMKTFLQNTGMYAEGVVSQYDILFCDNVDFHDKTIKASKKVFLACDRLGHFDDISKFEDFQYYIGFGKAFYQEIYETYGFECSTVLDGFVFNQAYEVGITVPDIDVLISGGNLQNYNVQSYAITVYHFCEYLNFVKTLINPNVVYGHNIPNFKVISDYITANLSGRSSFTDVETILTGMVDYSVIPYLDCFQSKIIKNTFFLQSNNFNIFSQGMVSVGIIPPEFTYSTTNNTSNDKNYYSIFDKNKYVYNYSAQKPQTLPNFTTIRTFENYFNSQGYLVFPRFTGLEFNSKLWKTINSQAPSKNDCSQSAIDSLMKIL